MIKTMELIVHPGIGDLSWLFSKLSTTDYKFDLIIAEDAKTRRALPLGDMVECVNSARYGGRELYELLYIAKNALFEDYVKAHEMGKKLVMTANHWVDSGNRLEGFLRDINTDFHYNIHGSPANAKWADQILENDRPCFGIYTSSMGGIEAWTAWSAMEWSEFIGMVEQNYPDVKFYLLGAKWDNDMRAPLRRILDDQYVDYHDLIGKTTLGQALELIRRLKYFAGFASGLTILANVVNTPVVMLYPKYLGGLTYSWPCPRSMANGSYQGLIWDRPVEIFRRIEKYLDRYLSVD